jgi:hypothetical protein
VRDDLALMSVALPRGGGYAVTLRYEAGTAENIGLVISSIGLFVFVVVGTIAIVRVRLRLSKPIKDSGPSAA